LIFTVAAEKGIPSFRKFTAVPAALVKPCTFVNREVHIYFVFSVYMKQVWSFKQCLPSWWGETFSGGEGPRNFVQPHILSLAM